MQPKKSTPHGEPVPDECARTELCPLSQVAAGSVVCVRELLTSTADRDRLRELGLGEDQRVRLVSRQNSVICQVCNARVALSEALAKAILVETISPAR